MKKPVMRSILQLAVGEDALQFYTDLGNFICNLDWAGIERRKLETYL